MSFVNHSCIPNCRYKEPKSKSGLAVLEVIRDVEKGDEITVFYGKEYFGKNNELCLCPDKEKYVSKDFNDIFQLNALCSTTRSGLKRSCLDRSSSDKLTI